MLELTFFLLGHGGNRERLHSHASRRCHLVTITKETEALFFNGQARILKLNLDIYIFYPSFQPA